MKQLKLWRYNPGFIVQQRAAATIDFDSELSTSLFKEKVFVRGSRIVTNYWANASVDKETGLRTYEDIVLKTTYTFKYDDDGYALTRDGVILYYDEDEEVRQKKLLEPKHYNRLETVDERISRHKNNINHLQWYLIEWLTGAGEASTVKEARGYLDTLWRSNSANVGSYVNSGDTALLTSLSSDPTGWLDTDLNERGLYIPDLHNGEVVQRSLTGKIREELITQLTIP